ncbi:hypothetical protein [Bradyrhizobium liaoningense]|uniref:hypothetical protein n=1 Tax=Bradyrhizobium liaoningense TaxID=43992 RepID=UPI001BA9757A|nr:hypothetical protein [Bradyrhizobium liaoningense]MBR0712679.1 hypothetical protein [Bradyrhizobium liaoningense]
MTPPQSTATAPARKLSRREAADYVTARHFKITPKTFANLAVKGNGPAFHKTGAGRTARVMYDSATLDAWAVAKLGAEIASTSANRAAEGRHHA